MSGATAIVAIYQASQSIYDVFDKVAVLYDGRQIYFGEKTAAKRYFIDMGFDCPTRQTTADFLTSITSPAERVTRPGFEMKVPHTPDEFAAAWQKSEDRAHLLREIDEFDRQYPIGGEQVEKFKVSRKGRQDYFLSNALSSAMLTGASSHTSQRPADKVPIHSIGAHAG